jgi:hypothetical protein
MPYLSDQEYKPCVSRFVSNTTRDTTPACHDYQISKELFPRLISALNFAVWNAKRDSAVATNAGILGA